jgi:hypothetical protein
MVGSGYVRSAFASVDHLIAIISTDIVPTSEVR